MLTKDNMTIGIEWRFGPHWPGQRCGAKTRRGTACQRPANKKNGRCRLHGGGSTGAKTEAGRARISAANLRHGKFTKDKLGKRRENAARGREIRNELCQMETRFLAREFFPALVKKMTISFLTNAGASIQRVMVVPSWHAALAHIVTSLKITNGSLRNVLLIHGKSGEAC